KREQYLFDLSGIGLFRRKKQRARKLLRERRRAFSLAALNEVLERSRDYANRINAYVLKEAVVFDGPYSFLHDVGNLVVGDRDAALKREFADNRLPVIGNDARHKVGAIIRKPCDLLRLLRHACLICDGRAKHDARYDR